MSFAPKNDLPGDLTNNTPGRSSKQSPAEILPLVLGRGRAVVRWQTPVLNWYFRNTEKSSYAFFSCYGWIAHGPADYIHQILVNGKSWNGVFRLREENPGYYIDHTLAGETPMTFRFWWGYPDQPNYGSYLDSLILDPSHAMKGKAHPAYRNIFAVAVDHLEAGRSDGGQTPPLPQVEISFYRRSPTAYSFGYVDHGTHPIGIVKDLLTLKRGGLKLDPTKYFDATHWSNQLNRLMTTGVAGITGTDLFPSFVFAESRPAIDQVSDVLAYIGGHIRERDGKLEVDWQPSDGSTANPTGLREIGQDEIVGDPMLDPQDLDDLPTRLIVTGLDIDADPDLSETNEIANVPYARKLLGEERPPVQISRPGWVTRSQLKAFAGLEAAIRANPVLKAKLKVLRQYAVELDGATPLRPGDRFVLNWAPSSLRVVVRILERSKESAVDVEFQVQVERGSYPLPYQPALDPRASLNQPLPSALTRYALTEVPDADPREVAPLVERPQGNITGFRVHYSPTNTWPGMILDSFQTWAVGATLKTSLANSTAATTVEIDTVGADWARILAQGSAAQLDDRLLLIIENEWLSVGAISVVSAGRYSLAVLRARQGSAAASHVVNLTVFLAYRTELNTVTHPEFENIGAPEYFKLQPYNQVGDGPLSSVYSVALSDRTPIAPTGLTAVPGTGKAVSLDWDFTGGENISEYAVYRNTVNNPATAVKIAEVGASRFVDLDVELSTLYFYWITAITIDEQEGPKSTFASVTTGSTPGTNTTPPPTPGALTVASGGVYKGKDGTVFAYVDLNLPANSPVAERNIFYRRTGSATFMLAGQRTSGAAGVYRVDDLLTGVSYDFQILDYNEDAYSSSSPILSPVITNADTTAPATPTGLTAAPGTGKLVFLDWDDSIESDFQEYGIYRNTVNNPATATKIAEQRASTFNDPDVPFDTPLYYWVTAIDRSENESPKSGVAGVTVSRIPDSQVDQTPPSNPGAASLSSSGTYNAGDGSVYSYLVISVPGLPSGAKWQNLLYKRTGGTEWIVAGQLVSGSTGSLQIDDLSPGSTYDVATQAFSAFAAHSAVVAAAGSPYTAPNKGSGPGAPQNATIVGPGTAGAGIPGTKVSGIIPYAAKVQWDPPADKDVAFYEVKSTNDNDPNSIVYTWISGSKFLQERFLFLYSLSLAAGFTYVRAYNRSGVAGAWAYCGNVNAVCAQPIGTISQYDQDNVATEGVKIGGTGSVKQTGQVAINTTSVSLSGGSPAETQLLPLPAGLSFKPDWVKVGVSNLNNVIAEYDWDHGANTNGLAAINFHTVDGSNLPGGVIRITGLAGTRS